MLLVPTMLRLVSVAMTSAVAVALCAVPASADFSKPRPVTPAGSDASAPRQATDRQGDSTFVWLAGGEVRLRIRKADGSLTPVRTVTDVEHWVSVLDVAVDDDGDGVVIWDAAYRWDTSDETIRLYARRFTRGGQLGPARPISPTDQHVFEGFVAVRPGGRAVVTWATADTTGDRGHVPWARDFALDGGRGPVRQVGAGPNASPPRVATDRSGRALLLWCNNGKMLVRRVYRNGGLGPTKTIFKDPQYGENLSPSGVGLDPEGGAFVVWEKTNRDTGRGQIWGRGLRPTLQPRTRAMLLSQPGHHAAVGWVDTDRQGDSVVAWTVGYFAGAYARHVRRDGVRGKVVKLSAGGAGAVLLGDDGSGVVVSTAYRNGLRRVIRATRVRSNGTFGGTIRVGVNDYDTHPIGGVSRSGRATIAWEQIHGERIMAVSGR